MDEFPSLCCVFEPSPVTGWKKKVEREKALPERRKESIQRGKKPP